MFLRLGSSFASCVRDEILRASDKTLVILSEYRRMKMTVHDRELGGLAVWSGRSAENVKMSLRLVTPFERLPVRISKSSNRRSGTSLSRPKLPEVDPASELSSDHR